MREEERTPGGPDGQAGDVPLPCTAAGFTFGTVPPKKSQGEGIGKRMEDMEADKETMLPEVGACVWWMQGAGRGMSGGGRVSGCGLAGEGVQEKENGFRSGIDEAWRTKERSSAAWKDREWRSAGRPGAWKWN